VLGCAAALYRLPAAHQVNSAGLMRRLDLPGMAAFTVAMTALMALLLSITTGVHWWLLPVLVGALVARELRAAEPFLDLRALAGNTALTTTYLRVGLTYTAFYLIFYGLPQWLEQGRGLSVTVTGLVMLPLATVGAATVLAATRLARRAGPRPLLIIGSAALLLGGAMLVGARAVGAVAAGRGECPARAAQRLPQRGQLGGDVRGGRPGFDGRGVRAVPHLAVHRANIAAAVLELTFAGPPSDAGLHRMGLVVFAAAAVLLAAALASGRHRASRGSLRVGALRTLSRGSRHTSRCAETPDSECPDARLADQLRPGGARRSSTTAA
jgi:hypothetical protein